MAEARPGCGCGCLSIFFVFFALYIGQLQWKFHLRDVRNAAFVQEAGQVADALEGYARDHGGVFPDAAEVQAALAPRLPGRAWPAQRWTHRGQPAVPAPLRTPDERMAYLDESGSHPLAGSAVAGPLPSFAPGRHASMAYGTASLGSLIYVTDPPRRRYVLYAVGGYALTDSPDGGVELPAIRLVRTNRR